MQQHLRAGGAGEGLRTARWCDGLSSPSADAESFALHPHKRSRKVLVVAFPRVRYNSTINASITRAAVAPTTQPQTEKLNLSLKFVKASPPLLTGLSPLGIGCCQIQGESECKLPLALTWSRTELAVAIRTSAPSIEPLGVLTRACWCAPRT